MGYITTLFSAFILAIGAAPMYAEAPVLKTEPASENYEISFISNVYRSHILFHAQKKFFIVDAGGQYLKLDAEGQEVFRLNKDKKGLYHVPFSSIIATDQGLYDLRDQVIKRHPFSELINAKKGVRLTESSFAKRFSDAYKRADTVVFGDYNRNLGRIPAYLRIAGKWIVFYVSYDTSEINDDYNFGNQIKGFPAKPDDMVLLQDPDRKQYSHAFSDIRDGVVGLKEKRLRYRSSTKLKMLSYNNIGVSEHLAYTNIPILKKGTALYRLSVGNETIDFKEIAVRTVLSRKVDTHLNLFIVPKSSAKDVSASFLEFLPGNNLDTMGSDGLYVIRPKR